MNLCNMEVPSVTYAQKAKVYFREKGIRSEVVRNTESCGYSVKVYADCNIARKVLDANNIPYKEKGISSW